ncbi:SMC family ATPase [Eubacteriaceae bacterium ES3]|nr:SMC family ATPase [Eubacteriaceae bacterium ES3]
MKPIKLTMSGFCPYADTVEIDFDLFDGSGLFLITGETGAGKTTIFDGISFALFGEASGENRGNDMLRSDFAKPETPTFVKLVFEDKGHTYEIERNPKYYRPKKRGDSGEMTLQNANASLILPDNGVISGAREVTDHVVELLGINHQQFKQISMVAQGEFLKLLFADSDERGKIFRKVFGTEIYERTQKELKNKMISLKKDLADIDQSILQYNDGIICEGEKEEAYLNLKDSVYGLPQMLLLLNELIEESSRQRKGLSEENIMLQREINKLVEQISKGEQINSLFEELEIETSRSIRLSEKADAIQIKKQELELGKLALYQVKPAFDDYGRLEKQQKEIEANIEKNRQVITQSLPLKERGKIELDKLKDQEPQREVLATEIKNLEASLPEYEKLAEVNSRLHELEGERKKQNERLFEGGKFLSEQKDRIENIQLELNPLKDVETRKIRLEQNLEIKQKERADLQEIIKNIKSGQDIKQEYKSKQKECQDKEQDYNLFKQQYDEQERLFYREQAGILAETLTADVPCPVCGSISHPNKAKKAANAPSQEKLNNEKKELEKIRTAWTKLSEICNGLKTKYETRREQIRTDAGKLNFDVSLKGPEILEASSERETSVNAAIKKLQEELVAAQQAVLLKQKLEKETEIRQNKVNLSEQEIEKIKAAIAQLEVNATAIKTEIQGFKKRLEFSEQLEAQKVLKEKQKDLSQRKAEFLAAQKTYQAICDRLNHEETLMNANSDQLEKTLEEKELAQKLLEKKLMEYGFNELKAYESAVMSEQALKEREVEINLYNQETNEIQTRINQLKKQIAGQEKADIQKLKNNQQDLKEKQIKLQGEQANVEHIIQTNQKILQELQVKSRERDSIEKNYSEIKVLSDTANGDLSGKQKLAFEQYVQGVYFDMILKEANKRFGFMSGNRYALVRKEGSADKKSKSGLEIDVKDRHTAKNRSVKSLSGGESFKASLSLALGLSDVVQNFSGGVQVETMFIDEGFGTLDSESLETAMGILADLTEGNRLVGIISHLEELKSRIDKKIVITRNPQGSSIQVQA